MVCAQATSGAFTSALTPASMPTGSWLVEAWATGASVRFVDLDLTGNGVVNGADLGLLLSQWGSGSVPADLNCDGTVDGADLGIILSAWGLGN